ncbi:pyridoxamine 5'-phosphate oxidase [Lacinutrix sp.]|jgi:pyridoxamine 5'-phosphate oxidase|uniref:pyridoxamine 5'-phosphate oxidase n=1 Tax=Lacinutrix sp. TaxID=1937692 RepID=UPI00262173D8|nr:pyridoxamine 5'-phosphate oxidase [Lacinutrix sp.]MDG1251396.1 pyridoxamine 5'-phosphate oxidase [Flavobacteriaceae bacterium]MDG1715402.1 pyridoxamine 5'-phosphate oxidase [Lacinutrix sp.]MDG2236078.1 pyridoxamine 5'-phosphate oxidase [Flavobacteriaceae bacterium]|tara:strand:- start:5500 stop:6150 length:651 start_codon:yes stop_codon:yes gene_type:complete
MDKEDLGQLRKSYDKSSLDLSDVGDDPIGFFKKWFDEASNHSEIEEANAMSLATLGIDDFPKSRVVLLKAFTDKGFVFYTNYQSEKGLAIAHHPKVGLSFFWPPLERQVIIKGLIQKTPSDLSDEYFNSRPKGSQLGAIVSDQSNVISDRTIIEAKLNALEIQYKNEEIPRPDNWGGYLVIPKSIEFWQGRPNRLHDRIRCHLRQTGLWDLERLAP